MQEVRSIVVERVQRGAEWCDHRYPEWFLHMNTERLNIMDPNHCIGKQLNEWLYPNDEIWRSFDYLLGGLNVEQYGFGGFDHDDDHEAEANAQWRYEIDKRRRERAKQESLKRHPSTGIYKKEQ